MTLDGTNGYVLTVGPAALVAIDPGIDDPAHIDAFMRIAHESNASYVAILVTHGHRDHYPGALALRRETRAPIYAHRSATFGYDRPLDDGMRLTFEDATIEVAYAPGHAPDHLVFWLEDERALFTGDVVIGTGTVAIAPPAGDMRRYQATLERLLARYGHADVIYGGHGPAVCAPRRKIEEYIEHRRSREAQIIAVLAREPATITALTAELYPNVDPALRPAAARQILAYLVALRHEGRVIAEHLTGDSADSEAWLLDLTGVEPSASYTLAR